MPMFLQVLHFYYEWAVHIQETALSPKQFAQISIQFFSVMIIEGLRSIHFFKIASTFVR